MLQVDNEKVYIEHCQHCSSHNWCTSHDESKYLSYYENIKAKILVICPELQVTQNQIPLSFLHKFSTPENSKPGKPSFPRIGSFEIYFKDILIFSKLESGQWPQSTLIANKIRDLIDKPKTVPSRELNTNPNLLQKRKNKRAVKSIEPNSSRNFAASFKSATPSKRSKREVFKEKKGSNESSEKAFRVDEGEVTKSYELVLPSDSLSNKKINYSNKSNNLCQFKLVSSDPANMMIKEENVVIPAGQTGKFQLRFPPVAGGLRKVYWLRVINNEEPWECFKFIVRYE